MSKAKHKISTWQQYNQTLVYHDSLTVWMDGYGTTSLIMGVMTLALHELHKVS